MYVLFLPCQISPVFPLSVLGFLSQVGFVIHPSLQESPTRLILSPLPDHNSHWHFWNCRGPGLEELEEGLCKLAPMAAGATSLTGVWSAIIIERVCFKELRFLTHHLWGRSFDWSSSVLITAFLSPTQGHSPVLLGPAKLSLGSGPLYDVKCVGLRTR